MYDDDPKPADAEEQTEPEAEAEPEELSDADRARAAVDQHVIPALGTEVWEAIKNWLRHAAPEEWSRDAARLRRR